MSIPSVHLLELSSDASRLFFDNKKLQHVCFRLQRNTAGEKVIAIIHNETRIVLSQKICQDLAEILEMDCKIDILNDDEGWIENNKRFFRLVSNPKWIRLIQSLVVKGNKVEQKEIKIPRRLIMLVSIALIETGRRK